MSQELNQDKNIFMSILHLQVMEKGMRFTMRDGMCTLGYGVVTDLMDNVDIHEVEESRKKKRKAEAKAKEQEA